MKNFLKSLFSPKAPYELLMAFIFWFMVGAVFTIYAVFGGGTMTLGSQIAVTIFSLLVTGITSIIFGSKR